MSLRENSEELRMYAEIDGGEFGETCILLLEVARRHDFLSEELVAALEKEICGNLAYFKENAIIVYTEETVTRKTASLEWAK